MLLMDRLENKIEKYLGEARFLRDLKVRRPNGRVPRMMTPLKQVQNHVGSIEYLRDTSLPGTL